MNPYLALTIDVLLFIMNVTFAILNRGELIGWVCAILACWQVYIFIHFVREL